MSIVDNLLDKHIFIEHDGIMDPKKRGEYLNWPNYLSFLRIILVPVVMAFVAWMGPEQTIKFNLQLGWLALFFFVIAGVSDVVDGIVARRLGISNTFGTFLDPLADKLMLLGVLTMMIPIGRVPAWLVVIILSREIIITALRGVAVSEKIVISASYWGKKKTACQNVGMGGLLVYYPMFGIDFSKVGWFFLALSLVISLGSGYVYVRSYFSALNKRN